MSLSGDNVDIIGDMYYKFLVQDCMWSGTCKEDNTHETTNKFSDFSYFSTSPVYGSIFDIFNIDDENSLGEINCDPEYDTSDQDDSPLNGLSAEDTEVVDETIIPTPSCSSSPTPSTSTSISSCSTLTGAISSTITPAGLLSAASTSAAATIVSADSSIIIKPTTSTSRATLTGKSNASNITKSTLSSKATKSAASSKVNSITAKSTISVPVASTSTIRATTSTAAVAATSSLVNPTTISATATVIPSISNSPATTPILTAKVKEEITTVDPTVAVAASSTATTSILKSTGKPRNPKSLYPERRKEHNNSEKKRRDHLRNAFNHLRDQIPKLKDGEKKAARVTILKESVSYVTLLKEKHRYLERTKNAETIKHENLLKRLKMLQSSTGASFNNNNTININNNQDSNFVYVQCNSSTVC